MEMVISEQQDGRVVRTLLQSQLKMSRRLLRQLVQTNGILRNGEVIHLNQTVRNGDIIRVMLPEETTHLTPVPMNLDICYEDDEIIVVNKPAGVLSHPTAWERESSILSGLLAYLAEQHKVPHCVHRLDRDTSGLVMFAKHSHAHHLFDIALQSDEIHRGYVAIVHLPQEQTANLSDWQTIRLPIAGDSQKPSRRVISFDGQAAITHYRLLQQGQSIGLVQLALETGRTHQIRLHLATIGMPIVGDPQYNWSYCMNPGGPERQVVEQEFQKLSALMPAQALHAYRLAWTHSVTKHSHAVTAQPPDRFLALLQHAEVDGDWTDTLQKLLQAPFAPGKQL